MIDDPCDEWPVVVFRGELYVVQTWQDQAFIVFGRVGDSLRAFSDRMREQASVFELITPKLERVSYVELDYRKARGYRQFEYGGKRWKGRR